MEPVDNRFHVLVAISNPHSLGVLLPPAIRAARENKGMVLLVHVITVPRQLPLSAGRAYIEDSRNLTAQAVAMVEAESVPVEVLLRISHRPIDAIVQTVYERSVDLLIMGWRGESSNAAHSIGQNVDEIVERVNCDALIIQQTQPPPYDRILIPVADPLQTNAAVRRARLLVADGASKIDVVHVFHPDTAEPGRQALLRDMQRRLNRLQKEDPELYAAATLEVILAEDVVEALVEQASAYDCVVLGATRDSIVKRRFFGSKPRRIAQQVVPAVVLVRPRAGAVGFGLRRVLNYFRGGYRRVDPASEKELQEQGILLSEADQNHHELHTLVNETALVLCGILGLIAVLAIYFGAGETATWIGVLLYLLALGWFTYLSVRSVNKMR